MELTGNEFKFTDRFNEELIFTFGDKGVTVFLNGTAMFCISAEEDVPQMIKCDEPSPAAPEWTGESTVAFRLPFGTWQLSICPSPDVENAVMSKAIDIILGLEKKEVFIKRKLGFLGPVLAETKKFDINE